MTKRLTTTSSARAWLRFWVDVLRGLLMIWALSLAVGHALPFWAMRCRSGPWCSSAWRSDDDGD